MSAGDGGWLPETGFVPSPASPWPSSRYWHAWTGRTVLAPSRPSWQELGRLTSLCRIMAWRGSALRLIVPSTLRLGCISVFRPTAVNCICIGTLNASPHLSCWQLLLHWYLLKVRSLPTFHWFIDCHPSTKSSLLNKDLTTHQSPISLVCHFSL